MNIRAGLREYNLQTHSTRFLRFNGGLNPLTPLWVRQCRSVVWRCVMLLIVQARTWPWTAWAQVWHTRSTWPQVTQWASVEQSSSVFVPRVVCHTTSSQVSFSWTATHATNFWWNFLSRLFLSGVKAEEKSGQSLTVNCRHIFSLLSFYFILSMFYFSTFFIFYFWGFGFALAVDNCNAPAFFLYSGCSGTDYVDDAWWWMWLVVVVVIGVEWVFCIGQCAEKASSVLNICYTLLFQFFSFR